MILGEKLFSKRNVFISRVYYASYYISIEGVSKSLYSYIKSKTVDSLNTSIVDPSKGITRKINKNYIYEIRKINR